MPNSTNFTSLSPALSEALGVGATIHYYRELAKAHEIHGSKLQLMMVHADMERVLKHAEAGESNQLAKYLAELIGRMQAGGAHIAAISAVTPHLCVNDLLAISPLPLVNLLDAVNDEDSRSSHSPCCRVRNTFHGRLQSVRTIARAGVR